MKQLFLSLLLSVPLVEAGKIGGRAQAKGEASSACEPSGMIPVTVHRNTIPAEMAAAAALPGKILSDTPELPLQAVRQYSDAGIQADEIAIPLEEQKSQFEMPRTIFKGNLSFKQLATLREINISPEWASIRERWTTEKPPYTGTSSRALEILQNILQKDSNIKMPEAGGLQQILEDAEAMFKKAQATDQKLKHANNIVAAALALDILLKTIDKPQATSDASNLLQETKTTQELFDLALHIKNAQTHFLRIEQQLASDIYAQNIAYGAAILEKEKAITHENLDDKQKAELAEKCAKERLSRLKRRYALLPKLFTSLNYVQEATESINATYYPSAELIEIAPQAGAAAAADDTDQIDGF